MVSEVDVVVVLDVVVVEDVVDEVELEVVSEVDVELEVELDVEVGGVVDVVVVVSGGAGRCAGSVAAVGQRGGERVAGAETTVAVDHDRALVEQRAEAKVAQREPLRPRAPAEARTSPCPGR